MDVHLYARQPIGWCDNIPNFSGSDFYTSNYEKIAEDHLAYYEKTGRNPFMDESHWRDIEDSTAKLLEKYCAIRSRVLDVGVGMGRMLERFPAYERYGIDISMAYLRHARAKGIDVCRSRIEDMPYQSAYFDCILCTDVLEHVVDLNQALAGMLRVLRPGGLLICRVPYRENLACYLNPANPYEFVHLRSFDEFSIRLFVEKICNRKLIEYDFCGFTQGRPRVSLPLPGFCSLVRCSIKMTGILGERTFKAVSRWFQSPTEINFVVLNEINKQRE